MRAFSFQHCERLLELNGSGLTAQLKFRNISIFPAVSAPTHGPAGRGPMSQLGQTEKYSERAIFSAPPPIADIRGGRLAGLRSGRSALPAPEQTNVYDLLAGWKLDCFLLIRVNGRLAPEAAGHSVGPV